MTGERALRLLRVCEGHTRGLQAAFGYVEDRPVTLRPLRDAVVTGRRFPGAGEVTGAVYDGSRALLASSQRALRNNPGDLVPSDPAILEDARVRGAVRLPGAFYGGDLFLILGHFLVESLARLWPLLDLRRRSGKRLPCLFHASPGFDADVFGRNPFFTRSLAAFGVRPDDVILCQEDTRIGHLLYPEPLSVYHEYLHPLFGRVLDHVAEGLARPSFLPRLRGGGRGATHLYLSRSRWLLHPRFANETEIEAVFRSLGFRIVHPQDLSPAETVRLMRGARFVASGDGSQAHLVGFCRPGTAALLLDTRVVPTQVALETLRQMPALHVPLTAAPEGIWDETTRRVCPERVGELASALLGRSR